MQRDPSTALRPTFPPPPSGRCVRQIRTPSAGSGPCHAGRLSPREQPSAEGGEYRQSDQREQQILRRYLTHTLEHLAAEERGGVQVRDRCAAQGRQQRESARGVFVGWFGFRVVFGPAYVAGAPRSGRAPLWRSLRWLRPARPSPSTLKRAPRSLRSSGLNAFRPYAALTALRHARLARPPANRRRQHEDPQGDGPRALRHEPTARQPPPSVRVEDDRREDDRLPEERSDRRAPGEG